VNGGDSLNVLETLGAALTRVFAEWPAVVREPVLIKTEVTKNALSPNRAATSATMASNRAG
jgi:hypothetical protein